MTRSLHESMRRLVLGWLALGMFPLLCFAYNRGLMSMPTYLLLGATALAMYARSVVDMPSERTSQTDHPFSANVPFSSRSTVSPAVLARTQAPAAIAQPQQAMLRAPLAHGIDRNSPRRTGRRSSFSSHFSRRHRH